MKLPFTRKKSFFEKMLKHYNFRQDIKILILIIAIIMIWRGVWNILDDYLLPDYKFLSNIVSIGIGIFIIFINDNSLKYLVDVEEE